MEKILLAIAVIAVVLGIKMIYDARPIVKKYFSFGQENEAVARNQNRRISLCHDWRNFTLF